MPFDIIDVQTRDSNQIQFENSFIKSSLCEKLLGVKFDHQSTFDQHIKSLCEKAYTKLIGVFDILKKQDKLKMNFFFATQLLTANMDNW